MLRVPLLIVFIVSLQISYGQQVEWIRHDVRVNEGKLMTGNSDGSFYVYGDEATGGFYGFAYQDGPAFWQHSIRLFDANGDSIWTEIFTDPIIIGQSISDGQDGLLIAGTFSGTANFFGTQLVSHGGSDIFIAHVKRDRRVDWARVLGGAGHDFGKSIAIMPDASMIVAGGVSSDVYMDGNLVQHCSQGSMMLARFDRTAKLLQSKVLDFSTDNTQGNCALRVVPSSPSGNVFMIGWREGRAWSQSGTDAVAGAYNFELDQNFDTLWSSLLINGQCYYGYQFGALQSHAGNMMVARYCGSKYGGNGEVVSLQGQSGTFLTQWSVPEANYADACSQGGITYFSGSEQMDISPSSSSYNGNAIIRKWHSQGNDLLLTSVNATFSRITAAGDRLIVAGVAYDSTIIDNRRIPGGNFVFSCRLNTTGINEQGQGVGQLNLFPVPTTGVVNIHCQNFWNNESVRIRVLDVCGKLCYGGRITISDTNSASIDLSQLSDGYYVVELSDATGKALHGRIQLTR